MASGSRAADNHYYKRVDPYIWTELAPVLDGSGSRHWHTRKDMSVDRVRVVFVARVALRNFYSSSKTDSRFSRSLKVTTGH